MDKYLRLLNLHRLQILQTDQLKVGLVLVLEAHSLHHNNRKRNWRQLFSRYQDCLSYYHYSSQFDFGTAKSFTVGAYCNSSKLKPGSELSSWCHLAFDSQCYLKGIKLDKKRTHLSIIALNFLLQSKTRQ